VPPAIAFLNPRLTTKNVGDIFIESSVKGILEFDADRSIDVDPREPITDDHIARINACDKAVIVGTNLWYRDLHRPGRWQFTAAQLERIAIPIIPLGIGTTRHAGEDNGFDEDTTRQLRIIHGSCREASVRDTRTAEALAESGITNVRMTGCPTLYRSLSPTWTLRGRSPRVRRVTVTVRKGQRRNFRTLVRELRHRNWDPVVAAQVESDLFLRKPSAWLRRNPLTVYEYDLRPYEDLVDTSHGVIGWRLHGNMFHLAHGNPAVFFANCSRSESFCASFDLPCVAAEDGTKIADRVIIEAIERLDDPGSFSRFAARYAEYYAEMQAFLAANDLPNRM